MGIIWTILIGFIIGLVAKFLMPGRDPAGFIITVIIGIVGSVIATFLGRAMGWYQVGQSAGFIAAVLGAIVLLYIYRLVSGKRG
ncbi:GlsB/YeaQ/YmgE family stress response membrane protein [Polaromonas sp. SM01]|uniref:GlsB/YeaQ/YmgE family stress response membrane protein n=1 Tax=Polaromonas sp. SM01 TaxID=3085630 RepID=UPI0029818A6C|nr:GlsB/YeaQ/YmgE family stress response membrane protein [Polaromonas sp. SM01]MDW5441137.1 GlsB/YeaQ/YmgE family stress response membrane protein [Polaromonas sp. SM01]